MIRELFYKWFGLPTCPTCEVLREQLEIANHERRELLRSLLHKEEPKEEEPNKELEPIKPKFITWSARRQMLEAEDRKKAQLMKEKQDELAALEKEVLEGIPSEKKEA